MEPVVCINNKSYRVNNVRCLFRVGVSHVRDTDVKSLSGQHFYCVKKY